MAANFRMKYGMNIKQRVFCKGWKFSVSQGNSSRHRFPSRVRIFCAALNHLPQTINSLSSPGDADQHYLCQYMSISTIKTM